MKIAKILPTIQNVLIFYFMFVYLILIIENFGGKMEVKKIESTNFDDYEILIRRRGDNDYASYCPQLNYMIYGTEHEEVLKLMQEHVRKYVEQLESKK